MRGGDGRIQGGTSRNVLVDGLPRSFYRVATHVVVPTHVRSRPLSGVAAGCAEALLSSRPGLVWRLRDLFPWFEAS